VPSYTQSAVACGGELRREVIRHKKPLVDLETGEVRRTSAAPLEGSIVQATSNADRPGFVIEVKRASEDKWKEVMEFYPAMGLPEQHEYQEAMLARCHSHEMATSVVSVMHRWLQVHCTKDTISFTGSRKHFPDEAAYDLVRTFTDELEHVVGGLREQSHGISIEELGDSQALPREGHLSEGETGTCIGALVGYEVRI
jgi:hypothetical protein